MPHDPHLYGQRPAKKQKKEIPLSSSLAFTSQLTSLLSASSSTPTSTSSGRARPSRQKDDIFSVKAKRKSPPKHHGDEEDATTAPPPASERPLRLRAPHGTEEEKQDFQRARRNMEEKARLYAAMKRGDYLARDNEAAPLVDFDRKWAESHPDGADGDPSRGGDSSSGSDNESSASEDGVAGGGELVEYKDEFGRTRTGTRAEVRRRQRRQARSRLGAAELEAMSARPAAAAAPDAVIHGDVIQSEAFDPEARDAARMADLAARRDRTPTPPPDAHFDGRAEIRTKGVGFYQFSAAEEDRRREMEALRAERESTERARGERESARERRRREIEERRRRIGRARAEKLADSFLDGLAGELGSSRGAGGGDDGKQEKSDDGAGSGIEEKAEVSGSAETTSSQKG
ncbi:hypothetical protein DL766_002726 [Monosporascus sp. MC13-8B]|uniref:Nuclear speckle splicing regulatory protein 1 N-terminal domain-containing protein n=1 Tax=Monosporascus cannonballus TaxID=155416 RepID=A0ABY0HMM0_9PEZI|nr:hypothetical protein DL762_000699 [Monosporascus cannonballus]RYO97986.1 hypothetical protein DL763_002491 [Monosporascus cannonballus]RYP35012.1 hypothetical protein DL766_002726 [Monosporascus sp. MC13-8B]